MATRCEVCGKKPMAGYRVSHSQRHTKRRWRPNVQRATLMIGGELVKVNLCTRCLRTHHKVTSAA
ncbi:MAG TPA: 50S ribosomal protein L28 [Chloroflexota bacterium]|nr:50S ribosomal protein L28 [Chloroflexota bacterium]